MIPYLHNMGANPILQDDNDRPHRAGVTIDDLQNAGMEKTGLACNNPDLDPTEPLWDQLGRDVTDQHDHVDEPEGWDPTATRDQAGDRGGGLLWLCTVLPPAAEAPYCVL